ncbi:MAG TPA: hypothetical protein DHV48_06610 [Prolixibacteraceae bacterium]|nr:hypothetical protein [Prolixibacteraceae bacterium]
MNIPKLSNIGVEDLRRFLKDQGLHLIKDSRGRGGHEKWSRADLDRPITIQTHITPVPEFIILQILRHLKMSKRTFWEIIKNS